MAPGTVEANATKEEAAPSGAHWMHGITFLHGKPHNRILFVCFAMVALGGLSVNFTLNNASFNNASLNNTVEQKAAKRQVSRELVLCVPPCNAALQDPALVRRGPRGSTDQSDVRAASYPLPDVLSKPTEILRWDAKPFPGPYLAIVSTRPENKAIRAAIRSSWGDPKRYPNGAFRLIFFLRAFPDVGPGAKSAMKELLKEAGRHADMTVEDFRGSSVRSMMLEWVPEIASAPRLLLWTRDSFVAEPERLLQWMNRLGGATGDVFGRIATSAPRGAQVQGDSARMGSDWKRLEQCAYFLKMSAVVRMSSKYEDEPPKNENDEEFELVAPSLARQSNLTFVALDFLPPCPIVHAITQSSTAQSNRSFSASYRRP